MPDNGDHKSPASAPRWTPEGSEWDWTEQEYPDGGVRLIFARGVPPEEVIEAFGTDPSAARLLSAEATDETLDYPWIRADRDPDRFVSQMRQAGLRVDPRPDDDDELEGSPRIAVLEMLTLALGIRLSREVAIGPLLTVQLGPGE